MIKTCFKILLIVFLTGLSLSMSDAAVNINSSSLLTDRQLEIMINNQTVHYLAVPYNNVLYVDRNLFSENKMQGEQTFIISGKNYQCIPLFSTLDTYGVLYDYKEVYDKVIVAIITDPALAEQYTANAASQPSEVNINIEEDDDVDYPWGLGLAVANTIHFFTDDDWYYIYRNNNVPDRFVWAGQNGTVIKGNNRFILNTDNRCVVKGYNGYVNIKKDSVYYRNKGENFGVFNTNVNNINVDRNINNINVDRNINNINVDRNINNVNVDRNINNVNVQNRVNNVNRGGGGGRIRRF
ncbi:MAG: hypothetical protein ABRQ38_05805 [Candidatus Eremiobacterota bacterium]